MSSTNQLDYLTSMCFDGERHVSDEWSKHFKGQTDVCLLCAVPHTRCELSWQQKRLRERLEIQEEEANVLKKAIARKEQEEAVVYWSELYDWVQWEHLSTKDIRPARIEAHKSCLLELQQKHNSASLMPITCDCLMFDPAPEPPPLPIWTKKYRDHALMPITCDCLVFDPAPEPPPLPTWRKLSWQQKWLRKALEIRKEVDVLKKVIDRKQQQKEAVEYWSGLLDRAWAEHLETNDTREARRIFEQSFLLELQQKKDSLDKRRISCEPLVPEAWLRQYRARTPWPWGDLRSPPVKPPKAD